MRVRFPSSVLSGQKRISHGHPFFSVCEHELVTMTNSIADTKFAGAFQISDDGVRRIEDFRSQTEPGYCQCGCGTFVGFWTSTDRANGMVKGEPKRFARGHARRGFKLPDADSPQYVANRSVLEAGPLSSPCHVWTRAKTAYGYGVAELDGKTQLVHRWLFEAINGPVSAGHELHHLCGNPGCVNPDHLLPVTRKQHIAIHAAMKAKAA